jgi:hypothetical protein
MKLLTILMLCVLSFGCGYGSHMSTTPATTPAISSFNPPNATAGGPAFTLKVEGQNFSPQAFVTFNGTQMTTVQDNSGEVAAMIPQAAIATAATVKVTVTNPGTGGIYGTTPVTSAAMNFTIQ